MEMVMETVTVKITTLCQHLTSLLRNLINYFLVDKYCCLVHRQELEDEMSIMNERVQKLGKLARIKYHCGDGSLSACHFNFIIIIQEK